VETKEIEHSIFIFGSDKSLRRNALDLSKLTTEEFMEYNKNEYNKYKDDNTKILYDDNLPSTKCYGYYIIALDWMSKWRGFVNGRSGPPGIIDNSALARRIKNYRN